MGTLPAHHDHAISAAQTHRAQSRAARVPAPGADPGRRVAAAREARRGREEREAEGELVQAERALRECAAKTGGRVRPRGPSCPPRFLTSVLTCSCHAGPDHDRLLLRLLAVPARGRDAAPAGRDQHRPDEVLGRPARALRLLRAAQEGRADAGPALGTRAVVRCHRARGGWQLGGVVGAREGALAGESQVGCESSLSALVGRAWLSGGGVCGAEHLLHLYTDCDSVRHCDSGFCSIIRVCDSVIDVSQASEQ